MMRNAVLLSLLLLPLRAAAQDVTPAETPAPTTAPKFFVHLNTAMNVYTYLGSTDMAPSKSFTPGDRTITYQFFGAGYQLYPQLRIMLSMQLAETVSGLPAGASSLTLIGFIPWAVWTPGRFFAGAGPLLAPRSYGVNQFDAGIFTAAGYGFPLGHGFTLAACVQMPFMFDQRFAFAVNPALSLGYKF